MEWYIPITILPGISLLILSTTNQMLSLSMEIRDLLSNKCTPFEHQISGLKIKQLGRLTKAATLLYIAVANFVISGLVGVLFSQEVTSSVPKYFLILGVILMLWAICYLIIYGFLTISIRKKQHLYNQMS